MGVSRIFSRKLLLIVLVLAVVVGVGGFVMWQDQGIPLISSESASPEPPQRDGGAPDASPPSGETTSPSAVEPEVLDQATASNVDPDSRKPIERRDRFVPSDQRVYAWVELDGLPGEHELTWSWLDPGGDPAFEKSQAIGDPEADQTTWRTWSWIPTRTESAGVQTGEWTVEAKMNGQTILSDTFTLQGEPPSPACGDVLYQDDFSNRESGWVTQEGEQSTWRYADDETYRLSTSAQSNTVWSWAPVPSDRLPESYCVAVEVRSSSTGAPDRSESDRQPIELGLVFAGQKQEPSFATFGIVPSNGVFRVRHRDFAQETSENRVAWTPSEPIEGPDRAHRLMIVVRPERVNVFIDGQRTERLRMNATGDLGVFLETISQAPAEARFDDFAIRELNP